MDKETGSIFLEKRITIFTYIPSLFLQNVGSTSNNALLKTR